MTPTALKLAGGIAAYLAPRLAADAKMPPIGPMVYDVRRTNLGAKKHQVAARIRYQMRGRIAMDADLDDLLDLLDALEEIGESEAEGEDRRLRGRGRARDNDPNDFGSGGFSGEVNGSAAGTGYGVNAPMYDGEDPPCSDPGHGLDAEEASDPYWKDEDEEERRRMQIAGSTGSQSIDDRIAANRARMRRAGDKRKAVLDKMRAIVRDALSARDQPPDFEDMPRVGRGAPDNSVLDPEAPEIDDRSTGGLDRRRVTGDAALGARSRMIANMRRIGTGATAYCPSNVGGSAPNFGNGASSDFIRRYPWAGRVKI